MQSGCFWGATMLARGLVTGWTDEAARDDALPDPFCFLDGRRVATPGEWTARRAEMIDQMLRIQYGCVPESPGVVRVAAIGPDEPMHNGLARRRDVVLAWGPEGAIRQTLTIDVPAEGTGPWPVVLRIGPDEPAPGASAAAGFIFVSFRHRELEPDPEGKNFRGPVQSAYPDSNWGSIAVWAWGASRALDYLLTVPEVDGNRIVVTGHSRCGKAALLSGALDERFALVAPSGSGCGGAGAYRTVGEGAETLALITLPERFASWFHPEFRRFSDREAHLPFDQHFLRALIAPRAVVTFDGLGDRWANPIGTQAVYQAAQPVFDFLGVPSHNALHFREGGHAYKDDDFRALLQFATAYFNGVSPGDRFFSLPFPEFRPTLPWQKDAPIR